MFSRVLCGRGVPVSRNIEKILVFCGSRTGRDPEDARQAGQLGELIGRGGYHLIYGGGNFGLMGVVAAAAREAGAQVRGIIPGFFNREAGGDQNQTDEIVADMHTRKQKMILHSDAAIVLPGGIGTLDELFETACDNDILKYVPGGADRPITPVIIVNVNGYYDLLMAQMEVMIDRGYMREEHRLMFHEVKTADEAMRVIMDLNSRPRLMSASELGRPFQ